MVWAFFACRYFIANRASTLESQAQTHHSRRMKKLFDRLRLNRPTFPPARRRCDLVVVSAISDGEWLGMEDLLDSLATYLDCDYEVVVVDDVTTDGAYERLLDGGYWVVHNPEKLHLAGIDLTLRRAFVEARRLFDAPIYLKIDPDALIIGTGLLAVLNSAFSEDSKIGLLGTYQIDWNGEPRDLSYWKERMIRRCKDLGKPYHQAIHSGYQVGDGVQGGAYALSRPCLDTIIQAGWFKGTGGYNPSRIKGQHIAEDSLITMLTYAAGYRAADIGGPGQPFGLWHPGMPMTPHELVAQNRLVTHAIKYRDPESLEARDYFRARRTALKSTRQP